jgi:2-methylcitrate dehydratase PrpD
MAQLEIVCDPAWNERAPGSFPCSIHARRDDGREFVAEVPDPPGFSRHGIDAKAVVDKFHAVTAPRLGRQSRDRLIEAVTKLDKSESCAPLTTALASASTH